MITGTRGVQSLQAASEMVAGTRGVQSLQAASEMVAGELRTSSQN